jgi:hypothetical protein
MPLGVPLSCCHYLVGHQFIGFWKFHWIFGSWIRNPIMDGIKLKCYGLHILMRLCIQLVHWYLFEGSPSFLCAHTIPIMTAKQALLLLRYHFYGLAVNFFPMLQKYTYSSTSRSTTQNANIKSQRQKKEFSEYFFILKYKYVDDLTVDTLQTNSGDPSNLCK